MTKMALISRKGHSNMLTLHILEFIFSLVQPIEKPFLERIRETTRNMDKSPKGKMGGLDLDYAS